MSLSDFFHSSDDHRPAAYTAYAVRTYHCGSCGLQLKREGWPQYCARGHKNVMPE